MNDRNSPNVLSTCLLWLLVWAGPSHASGLMLGDGDLFADLLVIVMMVVGLAGSLWLAVQLLVRKRSGVTRPFGTIPATLILLYLALELWCVHALDISSVQLGLYGQIVVLSVLLILAVFQSLPQRITAAIGLLAVLITLNLIDPKLIDFHDQVYQPSYSESQLQQKRTGLHWRDLWLDDGRRLIRTHPALVHLEGKSDYLQPEYPRLKVMYVVKPEDDLQPPRRFSLWTIEQTNLLKEGQDSVFVRWPILGVREQPSHLLIRVGTAALMDQNFRPEPQLLVEVLDRRWSESEQQDMRSWARLLLKHGADPDAVAKASGRPLLVSAAYYNHPRAAELLIEFGADVNARDRRGNTPLHQAVIRSAALVPILLAAGADVSVRNDEGQTSEERARRSCSQQSAACSANLDWVLEHLNRAARQNLPSS